MVNGTHELKLTDRKEMQLSGVLAVEISNDRQIILQTVMGTLTVAGSELKILYLNPEKTEAAVSGKVDGITYGKAQSKGRKAFHLLPGQFREG